MVYLVYLACFETKYLVPEGFTILRIFIFNKIFFRAFPVKMKLFLLNKYESSVLIFLNKISSLFNEIISSNTTLLFHKISFNTNTDMYIYTTSFLTIIF